MRERDQIADETGELLLDARRAGVNLGFLRFVASRPPFKVAKLRAPGIWVVADIGKVNESHGPEGFDMRSLIALRDSIEAVVLNEAGVDASNFAVALVRAIKHREIVAVVETTERHCADWTEFFAARRGGPPIMLMVLSPPDGFA